VDKEQTAPYHPGVRSPAWLKLKPKLSLEVVVTGGSAERIRWGDWGEAVMLAFRYTHPRTGAEVEILPIRRHLWPSTPIISQPPLPYA
jgi:ATP-dependent DNA ligase